MKICFLQILVCNLQCNQTNPILQPLSFDKNSFYFSTVKLNLYTIENKIMQSNIFKNLIVFILYLLLKKHSFLTTYIPPFGGYFHILKKYACIAIALFIYLGNYLICLAINRGDHGSYLFLPLPSCCWVDWGDPQILRPPPSLSLGMVVARGSYSHHQKEFKDGPDTVVEQCWWKSLLK